MDISIALSRFLSSASDLPGEVLHIIQSGSNAAFLDTISDLAFRPLFTDRVLCSLKDLLPEIASRRLPHDGPVSTVAFLGRIIHFSPYLAEIADKCLSRFQPGGL